MESVERVGIFGGIFDPATISHVQMAMEALNLNYLDRVILVPCGKREDKQIDADGEHRVTMLNMCVKELTMNSHHRISVDSIQTQNPNDFPTTYHLMKHYQKLMPKAKLVFIIGEILLSSLFDWDDFDLLNGSFSFLIYSFSHSPIKNQKMPREYQVIHTTFVAGESFQIKSRIKNFFRQQVNDVDSEKTDDQPTMNSLGILPDNTSQIPKVSDTLLEQYRRNENVPLTQRYLGIYGITTLGVIDYIIENRLYR